LRESGRIVREDIDTHGREIFRGGWKIPHRSHRRRREFAASTGNRVERILHADIRTGVSIGSGHLTSTTMTHRPLSR
jgi:hypothetical protein